MDFTNAEWRKSSRSNGGGQCVEVATNFASASAIRDSKLGDASPVLALSKDQYAAFISFTKKH